MSCSVGLTRPPIVMYNRAYQCHIIATVLMSCILVLCKTGPTRGTGRRNQESLQNELRTVFPRGGLWGSYADQAKLMTNDYSCCQLARYSTLLEKRNYGVEWARPKFVNNISTVVSPSSPPPPPPKKKTTTKNPTPNKQPIRGLI